VQNRTAIPINTGDRTYKDENIRGVFEISGKLVINRKSVDKAPILLKP
jgi:hypothetical protein